MICEIDLEARKGGVRGAGADNGMGGAGGGGGLRCAGKNAEAFEGPAKGGR